MEEKMIIPDIQDSGFLAYLERQNEGILTKSWRFPKRERNTLPSSRRGGYGRLWQKEEGCFFKVQFRTVPTRSHGKAIGKDVGRRKEGRNRGLLRTHLRRGQTKERRPGGQFNT